PLLPSRGPHGGRPMSHTSRGRRRLAGLTLLALVAAGVLAALPRAHASRALADGTPSPTPAAGAGCRLGLLIGVGFVTPPDLDNPAPHGPRQYQIARNSADAVAGSLIENWGFAESDVQTVLNADAKKATVLRAFANLLATVNNPKLKGCAGVYVVVYLHGHGGALVDSGGPGHYFVRMADRVDEHGLSKPSSDPSGLLLDTDLSDQITKLSAALSTTFKTSHLVVAVDACYAEGMFLDLATKLPGNVSVAWSTGKDS